jgi:hypothetical protein
LLAFVPDSVSKDISDTVVDNLKVTAYEMDLPVTENTEFLILEGVGLAKADAEP